MFPAQTSMMPVQVALARFLESNGLSTFSQNYPYWYLGTTPFRYLTGPILPLLLVTIHGLFPFFSLFSIFYFLLSIFWLIGGIGVYWLVRSLANSSTLHHPRSPSGPPRRCPAFLAALLYLFGPMVPFLFRFSDGLYLMAFSFLPWILLVYFLFLQHRRHRDIEGKHRIGKIEILLCLLVVFVILLESLIIPTLILGMAAIFLAQVGWKRTEEKLKQSCWLLAVGCLLVTLWYTPSYWLTLLGGPSWAGKGLAAVIVWLGKLLPTVLALFMAVVSVNFFKRRHLLRDFCFYWLAIFGFLTLIRFLSDPDFWLDWTAYGVELQFGIGMGLALIMNKFLATTENTESQIQKAQKFSVFSMLFSVSVVAIFIFGSWFLLFNRYVLGTFQHDIKPTVEYRIGKELSKIIEPGQRVFLSGTTAFWLNAFFDIAQVRGGRDQVSVDPNWRKAAWEVREGQDLQKTLEWLKKLEVDYLVVHTEESEEFYHDFRFPEKFENVPGLTKIYEENGDRIYQVSHLSL